MGSKPLPVKPTLAGVVNLSNAMITAKVEIEVVAAKTTAVQKKAAETLWSSGWTMGNSDGMDWVEAPKKPGDSGWFRLWFGPSGMLYSYHNKHSKKVAEKWPVEASNATKIVKEAVKWSKEAPKWGTLFTGK